MSQKDEMEKRFLEAYENYADAIFRHCFFRVHNRETALDLSQETFQKTWQYLAEGRSIEKFKPFLYRVATNLIIDKSRSYRPQLSLESLRENGFDIGEDKSEQTQAEVDTQFLMKFVGELDDIYKEALLMRYIEGYQPQEIAEIVGESPNTISVRIHRAEAKLRKLIREEIDE